VEELNGPVAKPSIPLRFDGLTQISRRVQDLLRPGGVVSDFRVSGADGVTLKRPTPLGPLPDPLP
jgi:hypothetical protein